MRRAGHVACIGERRGVYRVLVGNLTERDHLEDSCLDGEDKIMMDLQEVGWGGGVYWIYLA